MKNGVAPPGRRGTRGTSTAPATLTAIAVLAALLLPAPAITAAQAGAGLAEPPRVGAGLAAPPIVPPPFECAPGAGSTYDVGPAQPYASIGAVPWEDLTAGDTVRIHWRAEPYPEKILLRGQGDGDRPIVVCGVAGPGGTDTAHAAPNAVILEMLVEGPADVLSRQRKPADGDTTTAA